MPGFKFSVPYNNNFEIIGKMGELKNLNGNRIEEIYLSGPQEYFGSGRITPRMEPKNFIKVVKGIHDQGFKVNLLMNSTCEGLDWYQPGTVDKTIRYVKHMYEDHGVEGITIANPLYVQKIKKEVPRIKITASVLSDIDSVERAIFFDKFGVDVITPDRDINRNLDLLTEIREAINADLRLMVNEGCLFKCPYRKFHFNMISHYSKNGIDLEDRFFFNCYHITRLDTSQALKSCWVRPEDTRRYSHITKNFKVVGRTRDTGWITQMVKAYLNESLDGNLLDIMDSNLNEFSKRYDVHIDNKALCGFFEKVINCDKNCLRCGCCEKLAGEVVRFRG